MSNVIRLNVKRQAQTQIEQQDTPYMQIVSLTADIEDQMQATIRRLFKNGDTFAGHALSRALTDVKFHLVNAAEQAAYGE